MSTADEESIRKPTLSIMSNRRLNAIKEALISRYGEEEIEKTMSEICEIIKFNKDYRKASHNPAHKERASKWRERKAEEYGVSVSMVANGKYKQVGNT